MSIRNISIIGLLLCLAALGGAYYLQEQYMLAACPLCMLQRITFMAMAAAFLCGALIKFSGYWRYLYSALLIIFSAAGVGVAARQLWLQYFAPPQLMSCAASLERLIELYPLLDALKLILKGSAECATIDFTILGLSIAAWSFALFSLILIAMIGVLYLQKKRRI